MALYVNTNVSSINSQNKLNNATNSLNTTYQRLASGLRINSAKDDSAGLQISNRMTAQINGLNQGNRNANDGIALAQTAEGAMDEMTSMLQKIRTLALQSANGTNTSADRVAIQKDVTALDAEITRISEKTTFNGQTLLSGKDGNNTLLINGKVNFQVGSNANDTLGVDLSAGFDVTSVAMEGLKNADLSISIEVLDGTSTAGIAEDVINISDGSVVSKDTVINTITGFNTASSGVILRSASDPTKYYVSATTAATFLSGANDQQTAGVGNYAGTWTAAPAAGESATFTGNDFKNLIEGLAFNKVTGADEAGVKNFIKDAVGLSVTTPTEFAAAANTLATDKYDGTISMDVSTAQSSQGLLSVIDSFIGYVDGKRADLGAIQNRMESTIRNQSNIMENTTDARSRIRDTDFAAETANLTQQSIIQQAASSMLMQANQRPQMALSLLG